MVGVGRFSKLDVVLTGILIVAYIPLSLWGGAKYWAGVTHILPLIMLYVGAVYVIFESIRLRSLLVGTLLGGLVPLLTIGPSLFLYPLKIEEFFSLVPIGCFFGLIVSSICWSVEKRKAGVQMQDPADITDHTTEASSPSIAEVVPSAIGGWLILPAIGLVLAPLVIIAGIISQFAFLSSRGVDLLSGFEFLGKLALFIFVCFVAFLFFKKQSSAPKSIILYMLANLAFACIRFVWGLALLGADEAVLISLLRSTNIVGFVLASAIWIPYFKKSKRVKATFTKQQQMITTRHRRAAHWMRNRKKVILLGIIIVPIISLGIFIGWEQLFPDESPIHWAVGSNNITKVTNILSKSPKEVNARDKWGGTPIHCANSKDMIELLLRNGANINARDINGRTPLHSATRRAANWDFGPEGVEALLSNGADPNAEDYNGHTPIYQAGTIIEYLGSEYAGLSTIEAWEKLKTDPKRNEIRELLRKYGAK